MDSPSYSMHFLPLPLPASLAVCADSTSTIACVGLVTTELIGAVFTTVFIILALLQMLARPAGAKCGRRPRTAQQSPSDPLPDSLAPAPTPEPCKTIRRCFPVRQSTFLDQRATFQLPRAYEQRARSDPGLSPSPAKSAAQFDAVLPAPAPEPAPAPNEPATPTQAASQSRPRSPRRKLTAHGPPLLLHTHTFAGLPCPKRPFQRSKSSSRILPHSRTLSEFQPHPRSERGSLGGETIVESPLEMSFSPSSVTATPRSRSATSTTTVTTTPRPHSFPSSRAWSDDSSVIPPGAEDKGSKSTFWRRKREPTPTSDEGVKRSATVADLHHGQRRARKRGHPPPPPYTSTPPSKAVEKEEEDTTPRAHRSGSGFAKKIERLFHHSPVRKEPAKPSASSSPSSSASSTLTPSHSRHATLSRRKWKPAVPAAA